MPITKIDIGKQPRPWRSATKINLTISKINSMKVYMNATVIYNIFSMTMSFKRKTNQFYHINFLTERQTFYHPTYFAKMNRTKAIKTFSIIIFENTIGKFSIFQYFPSVVLTVIKQNMGCNATNGREHLKNTISKLYTIN